MAEEHEDHPGPRLGFDIIELLISTFSGQKDDYGKETVPPIPLLFDRVCEGRNPASNAPLFFLPFEILSQILHHVPDTSLASLAQVNSDCRQLARSRQFTSILLDYSDQALALVAKLLAEGDERSNGGGLTKNPGLGPCIRRITISTRPEWIVDRHHIELSEEYATVPKAEQNRRRSAANDAYFNRYLLSIQKILSDQTILPHLELVDFQDRIVLNQSFFVDIANSKVQHLRLGRIMVNETIAIDYQALQPGQSWPLRSLNLDIYAIPNASKDACSTLSLSLLHLCAPTLESFDWQILMAGKLQTRQLGPHPQFPSLRALRLPFLNIDDDALLRELIHDNLQALEVQIDLKPTMATFFERRGRVPALKTFVWPSQLKESQSLSFLAANPGLSKLSMPKEAPEDLLNSRVLPLLVRSFSRLTSLCLVWDCKSISSSALEQISKIRTLEQLRLSAGCQFGWRHDWLIDHGDMQELLPALPLLRTLAFSRDSYDNGVNINCDRYYESKYTCLEDLMDSNWSEEAFEKKHRDRMLHEGDIYFASISRLKFLFFGMIPMGSRQGMSGKKTARALTAERDECETLLRETFGWKGILPA
ncbi:MAG: hypothetical protein Q9190_007962 [Brigantiaea leucoxantha]